MQLARTILQQNTDPTFFDDVIKIATDSKKNEIANVLKHGKEHGFSEKVLDWILDEYDTAIREVLTKSYHPVMIKELQKYAIQQRIEQWNIATHPFITPDEVYDFFAPCNTLNIKKDALDQLVERAFSKETMLLGTSFIFTNRDDMYFVFSKIEKSEPDEDGFIPIKLIEEKIMTSERKGLNDTSGYLQEKFPKHNLFQLLKLDPEKIL